MKSVVYKPIKVFKLHNKEEVFTYNSDLEPEVTVFGHYFTIFYKDGSEICNVDYDTKVYGFKIMRFSKEIEISYNRFVVLSAISNEILCDRINNQNLKNIPLNVNLYGIYRYDKKNLFRYNGIYLAFTSRESADILASSIYDEKRYYISKIKPEDVMTILNNNSEGVIADNLYIKRVSYYNDNNKCSELLLLDKHHFKIV